MDTTLFTEFDSGVWYENATGLPWKTKIQRQFGLWEYDGPPKLYKRDKDGYYRVQYKGQPQIWQRIVWQHFKGAIPDNMEVDHIVQTLPLDSRISNLQLLDSRANNCKKAPGKVVHDTSGYPNVYWCPRPGNSGKQGGLLGAWIGRFRYKGKVIHVGFDTDPERLHQKVLEKQRLTIPIDSQQ